MRWSGTDRPVLVVGYGNSLRRDDGAGLFLAEAIVEAWQARGLPASLLATHQLSPELAVDIAESGAENVLFVDAAHASASPGSQIETAPVALPRSTEALSPSLGHHLSPAVVMQYARDLFDFRGRAWLVSIPGYDFGHGEGLSAPTQKLVDEFLTRSPELWEQIQAISGLDSAPG